MNEANSNSGAEAPDEQAVITGGNEQCNPRAKLPYHKRTPGIWANPKKRRKG